MNKTDKLRDELAKVRDALVEIATDSSSNQDFYLQHTAQDALDSIDAALEHLRAEPQSKNEPCRLMYTGKQYGKTHQMAQEFASRLVTIFNGSNIKAEIVVNSTEQSDRIRELEEQLSQKEPQSTGDTNSRIGQIKERLSKITQGEWKAFDSGAWGGQGAGVAIGDNVDMWPLFDKRTGPGVDNSFFVAHAPDDIRYLLSLIKQPHSTRGREFWLCMDIYGQPAYVHEQWPGKYAHQYIHVREVLEHE